MATINWLPKTLKVTGPSIVLSPTPPQPANKTSTGTANVVGTAGDRQVVFKVDGKFNALPPGGGYAVSGFASIAFEESFTLGLAPGEQAPSAYVSVNAAYLSDLSGRLGSTLVFARKNVWKASIPWFRRVWANASAMTVLSAEVELYSMAGGAKVLLASAPALSLTTLSPTDPLGQSLETGWQDSAIVPLAAGTTYILAGTLKVKAEARGTCPPGTATGTKAQAIADGNSAKGYGAFHRVHLLKAETPEAEPSSSTPGTGG